MKRACWIALGATAQLLFLCTVYQMFAFLYAGGGDLLGIEPLPLSFTAACPIVPEHAVASRLVLDLLLLLQFGVGHSLLLLPPVRRKLERIVPGEIYGALYAAVASAALLLTFLFWQPLSGVVYVTEGVLAWLLLIGFLTSWVALVYSIKLGGLGFYTGLAPWWAYVCRRPAPRRSFAIHGAYRWLRHPVYLSVLGMIWLTPSMRIDHLLVAIVWSGYIYVGSVLKDRRLLFFIGERYRDYMEAVPGYPLVLWGPLSRLRRSAPDRMGMLDSASSERA